MNILMMTNAYLPHLGGVARSVEAYTRAYRRGGHRTVVVAPEYENQPEQESDVLRVPALQRFNGSDFSIALPIPGYVASQLEDLRADVVHVHHPFLLGATGMRLAHQYRVPLVYTYHTMYEYYTHYVPVQADNIKHFIIELTKGFCNLSDHIIAPSESVAEILRQRGVTSEISSLPTGVDVDRFDHGDEGELRDRYGVPRDAFVVGHVGRLVPEKNLLFLAHGVRRFLAQNPRAHCLLVGRGPTTDSIVSLFSEQGLDQRLHVTGPLEGDALINAYHAMDTFVFTSKTETQGMVIVEAMAAGTPVVALDAPGSRDVLRDGENGCLVHRESRDALAEALQQLYDLPEQRYRRLVDQAREDAQSLSIANCAHRMTTIYRAVIDRYQRSQPREITELDTILRQIKTEWKLLSNLTAALKG